MHTVNINYYIRERSFIEKYGLDMEELEANVS